MGRPLEADALVQQLVGLFAELPQVEAITLGGSRASGQVDAMSDIDLYAFTTADIPVETRRNIVRKLGGASSANLGIGFFDDAWVDAKKEVEFDVTYFNKEWFERQLEWIWQQHHPSPGYTTAFCYTTKQAQVLYDPSNWFGALQKELRQPYPEPLRDRIVAANYAIVRNVIPSYRAQFEKAVARQDVVSVNHRLAALLASYFDIIFAVNRALHPGEKRLLQVALTTCKSLPENFERDVTKALSVAGDDARLLSTLTRLLDALDAWLIREGFDVNHARPVRVARAE